MEHKHTCPTCGKDFVTDKRRSIHCSRHCSASDHRSWNKGRTIKHICPTCGKEYIAGHNRSIYCSRRCSVLSRPAWNKGLTGLPASRPKNGTDKVCALCGATFYAPNSNSTAQYCSRQCYAKARYGESHLIAKPCVICGTPFSTYPSARKTTCSAACSHERKRLSLLGEKSHLWRGGKTAPYHKDWHEQRRLALERDGYRCALCGSTDRIGVHHIIPHRYSHSHDLDNLVTLCRSCHSRQELKVNKESANGLLARWPTSTAI